ncbi:MAG TPA: hypothetical protein VJ024_03280 [Thermodesulfovibrionales bacterium]|nr:hypothetical protein [Thermodesulfovibrionales bacterium]
MEQLYIDKRLDTESIMGERCPYLEEEFCRMSGIEREMEEFIDKKLCRSSEWNKCTVYISQFYYDPNDSY